ncbi:hypothetical protein THAOC_03771, partial [Thalassiosira oceanica]
MPDIQQCILASASNLRRSTTATCAQSPGISPGSPWNVGVGTWLSMVTTVLNDDTPPAIPINVRQITIMVLKPCTTKQTFRSGPNYRKSEEFQLSIPVGLDKCAIGRRITGPPPENKFYMT